MFFLFTSQHVIVNNVNLHIYVNMVSSPKRKILERCQSIFRSIVFGVAKGILISLTAICSFESRQFNAFDFGVLNSVRWNPM